VVGHPHHDRYSGNYWADGQRPRLLVQTTDRLLTYQVRIHGPVFGPLVRGAAGVDGVRGDELLLGEMDGAHGQLATVVSLRGGTLIAIPAPKSYGGPTSDAVGPSAVGTWGRDGSIMSNLGWHCLPHARMELFTAGGELSNGSGHKVTYTVRHRIWQWTDAGWRPRTPMIVRTHQPASSLGPRYWSWTGCGTFD